MDETTRTCVQCGELFSGSRAKARAKYCSTRCKKRASRGKPAVDPPRLCLLCCTNIDDLFCNAKYCKPCRKLDGCRRQRVHRAKQSTYVACAGCHRTYGAASHRQFCSRACAAKYASSKNVLTVPIIRNCAACGEPFRTTNIRKGECGHTCRQWRYCHPGVQRILDKECAHCLTPFRARTAKRKFCSDRCGRSSARYRRESRIRLAYVEDVSKGRVAVRDKWRCQLCGKRVNKVLQHPHPMSWSLDHVIPIARGGEHSYANTQLAHLVCNIIKRERTLKPQQLALIG